MAEQEVVAAVPVPVPSDHKRKLEDIDPPAAPVDMLLDSAANPDAEDNKLAASGSSETKRPRLVDDETNGSTNENGFKAEKLDEPAKQEEEALLQNEVNKQSEDVNAPSELAQPTIKSVPVEGTTEETEQQPIDNHESTDAELGKVESFEAYNGQEPPIKDESKQHSTDNHETTDGELGKVESFEADEGQEPPTKEESKQPYDEKPQQVVDDGSTITHRMEVPNAKVGVLIGKAGDTIRYLQFNSGAKIQITKDADADLDAPTRPVEIIGTSTSIIKAEKLINAVIAEADAGGSPFLVARGLATTHAAGAADQIEMPVPNEKVGFIIGRGGETIRGLQTRSGARIQLIPQHLPEGDGSKERIVRVTGDKRQIEIAREMIEDVMNQNVRPQTLSGGFNQQQGNRPRGTTGPPQWGSLGHPARTSSYDFQQRGPYPSQSSHYQPPYGGYPPHQMAPRSNFGSSWEQRPHSLQGPPHSGGYDYYSRQGSVPAPHLASIRGNGPGPTPVPAMGPVSSQSNYNYAQPHGPSDYAHPPPYSNAAPQHSYGHGYGEKYENHTPVQHPYGVHRSSQSGYAPAGSQPVYAPLQQQYVKPPSYATQAQGPQAYGPPANQAGEVPYQGPSGQSYGPNVPPQQQYPYGSAPTGDGYTQPPPVTYSQGGQPVPGYSQLSAQQATAYAQVNTAAGYGLYPPSQQGYSEQAAPNNAAYVYQGTQDSSYGGGAVTAYGAAPPPGGQATYAQPTAARATYDQSGGCAAAPVAYGKTISPQPGYPQYDSTQMYAAAPPPR